MMSLKKNLKSKPRKNPCGIIRGKRAQAVVEYITILLIVLGLLIAFLNGVRTTLQAYHGGMVNQIATQ